MLMAYGTTNIIIIIMASWWWSAYVRVIRWKHSTTLHRSFLVKDWNIHERRPKPRDGKSATSHLPTYMWWWASWDTQKNVQSTEVLREFCTRATFLRSVPAWSMMFICSLHQYDEWWWYDDGALSSGFSRLTHQRIHRDTPQKMSNLRKFYVSFVPERHFCGVSQVETSRDRLVCAIPTTESSWILPLCTKLI